MKNNAPFLDMKNDMKPKKYPQDFVYANKEKYPCNEGKSPSASKVMNQVNHAKK